MFLVCFLAHIDTRKMSVKEKKLLPRKCLSFNSGPCTYSHVAISSKSPQL